MSVTVAATELGITPARLRSLIVAGRLPAEQIGRTWVIRRPDLDAFKALPRPPGRPVKRGDIPAVQ